MFQYQSLALTSELGPDIPVQCIHKICYKHKNNLTEDCVNKGTDLSTAFNIWFTKLKWQNTMMFKIYISMTFVVLITEDWKLLEW